MIDHKYRILYKLFTNTTYNAISNYENHTFNMTHTLNDKIVSTQLHIKEELDLKLERGPAIVTCIIIPKRSP